MEESNNKKIILIGFIIGFLFFNIINRGEKKTPLFGNSIIINFTNNKYHIHHWIIFLVIFLLLVSIITWNKKYYTNFTSFILGICLGSILQGLSYNDAFDIKLK